MVLTLHGLSTMHSNMRTDIRIAQELEFAGIEIVAAKLLRYIELGLDVASLSELLSEVNVEAVCINAIKDVEAIDSTRRTAVLNETRVLCRAAEVIQCPTIQLVPFSALETLPEPEIVKLTALNIREIARIGADHGVRFQLEPIAYSPIHTLSQSLRVIEECSASNVGMVVDFWHLWAGGGTTPEEVAGLPSDSIFGIHFCDGIKRKPNEPWNEAKLRSFLPGDGEIDIDSWVDAVFSTGYDGSWSSELYSPVHWEWDLFDIARETKARMLEYLSKHS